VEPALPTVAELQARYENLRPKEDFGSFTERMEVLRTLGRLRTPKAQAFLLHIVESSKRLDDEVVAMMAMGPALDLPQTEALSRFLQRRGGHVRIHAFSMALADAGNPDVVAWLRGEGLDPRVPETQQAALNAQYFHADPRALARLQEIFGASKGRERHIDLAYAAVRAIGSVGSTSNDEQGEVRRFLLRAGESPDYRFRLAAADVVAMQETLDINLRGLLRSLLTDEVAVVRQAASASIGRTGNREFVPELAERLNDERIKTRDVAYAALVRMTKEDLGYDAGLWKAWFKTRLEPDAAKIVPYATNSSYFGVRVHTDRVMFIVDLSGSMAFPWGQDTTRLDVARSELQEALKNLAPGTLFNIIAFSDKAKSWRRNEAIATPDTVKSALKWMERVFKEPRGGTYLYAALEKAFTENPRIDTIFLLTDGLATDGEPIVPEAILASVSEWNRYRRVTIHTFALTLEKRETRSHEKKDFSDVKDFLRRLARLTGGVSRVIDDLPPRFQTPPPEPDTPK
jgi:hypothetical protein